MDSLIKKYIFNNACWLIIVLLLVSACSHSDKDQTLREQTIKELKLPATISFSENDTSNSEFLNQELSEQLNSLNKSQLNDNSKIKFNYQDFV